MVTQGFVRDPVRYGAEAVYELTAARAAKWHPSALGCRHGDRLGDLIEAHARPAGFEIVLDGGTWAALRGPGIAEENIGPLYDSFAHSPS